MMMVVFLGLVFLGSNQPMMLVFMLFIITIYYSVYLYSKVMTFWYSFIIMLVVLSGILVIFTYMASMLPNEKFELALLVFVMMMVMGWLEYMNNFCDEGALMSMKLWDASVMMVNLYMMSYLMIIMLMVVWMSDWWSGPVRN